MTTKNYVDADELRKRIEKVKAISDIENIKDACDIFLSWINENTTQLEIPSEEKPLPCCFCGDQSIMELTNYDTWYIFCNNKNCKINPGRNFTNSKDESIKAWNEAMNMVERKK